MLIEKTFQAPAKVNLCLNVLRRRPDGYHDVAMLMQQVDLADRVRIRIAEGDDIVVDCPGLSLAPGESNIAGRAAGLLLEHVGLSRHVVISIEKNIPAAAGLGGGSSDAAAVLSGLNEMLALNLSRHELMALGVRLGADVPFFLFGQTAWATGVGERLQPWPGVPPLWLLLVNPGVAVSTAWVYQNLGLTGAGTVASIPKFPEGIRGLVRLLHNDLEPVTCRRYPLVAEIKQQVLDNGALGALMSGSGPTVFGVFDTQAAAELAAEELCTTHGWWTKAVALR